MHMINQCRSIFCLRELISIDCDIEIYMQRSEFGLQILTSSYLKCVIFSHYTT